MTRRLGGLYPKTRVVLQAGILEEYKGHAARVRRVFEGVL